MIKHQIFSVHKLQTFLFNILFCALFLFGETCLAQNQEKIHDQLREIKDHVVEAVNSKNHDSVLKFLHPNIIVVAENTQIARGKNGVAKFVEDMIGTKASPLKDFTIEDIEVAEKSSLYDEKFAIAYGTGTFRYTAQNSEELVLPSTWTASLVNQDGHWLITHFQNTVNFTDNPFLEKLKTFYFWLIALAFALGISVFGSALWMFKKKR